MPKLLIKYISVKCAILVTKKITREFKDQTGNSLKFNF